MIKASENIIKWFGQDNSTKRDLSLLVQASIAESGTAIKEDDLFVPLDVNEDGSIDENFEHFYIGRGIAAQYFSKKALALRTENGEVNSPTNQAILKEVGVLTEDTENPPNVTVAPNYSVRIGDEEGKAVVETKTENGTEVSVSPQIEAGTVINPQSVAAAKETPKPLPAVTYAPKVEPTPATDVANPAANSNDSNARVPSSNSRDQQRVEPPNNPPVDAANPTDAKNITKDEIDKKINDLGGKLNVKRQEVNKETSIEGKKKRIQELRALITEFEKYINDNSANIDTKKKTDLTNGINDEKRKLNELEASLNKLNESSKDVLTILANSINSTKQLIKANNEINIWNPFDHIANRTSGDDWWNPFNHSKTSSGNGKLNAPLEKFIEDVEGIKTSLEKQEIDTAKALDEYKKAVNASGNASIMASKEVQTASKIGSIVVVSLPIIVSAAAGAAFVAGSAAVGTAVTGTGVAATTTIAGTAATTTTATTAWGTAAAWATGTGLTVAKTATAGTAGAVTSGLVMSGTQQLTYDANTKATQKELTGRDGGFSLENIGKDAALGASVGSMQGFAISGTSGLVALGLPRWAAVTTVGSGTGLFSVKDQLGDPTLSWDKKLTVGAAGIIGGGLTGASGYKLPNNFTGRLLDTGVQATSDWFIMNADGKITEDEIVGIITGGVVNNTNGALAAGKLKPIEGQALGRVPRWVPFNTKIDAVSAFTNRKVILPVNKKGNDLLKGIAGIENNVVSWARDKASGKPSAAQIKAKLDSLKDNNVYANTDNYTLEEIQKRYKEYTEKDKSLLDEQQIKELDDQLALLKEVLAAHGITDTPPPQVVVQPSQSEQQSLKEQLDALPEENTWKGTSQEDLILAKKQFEEELKKADLNSARRQAMEEGLKDVNQVLKVYEDNTPKSKGRLEAAWDRAKEAGAKFQEWNKKRQLAAIEKKHGDKYIKMPEMDLLANREAQKRLLDNPALSSTDKVAARRELEIIDKVIAAQGIKVPNRGIIDKFVSPSLEKLAAWSDNQRWLQSALGSRPARIFRRTVGWVWNKATGLASPVTKRVNNFVALRKDPKTPIENNDFLHKTETQLKDKETTAISDLKKAKDPDLRDTIQEDIKLIRQAQRYQETRANLYTILEAFTDKTKYALEAQIAKFKANKDEVVKKKAIEDVIEHLKGNISKSTPEETNVIGQKIDLLESLLAEPQKISNETPAAQTGIAKATSGFRKKIKDWWSDNQEVYQRTIGFFPYLNNFSKPLINPREGIIYLDGYIYDINKNQQTQYNIYDSNKQSIPINKTRTLNREETYYSRPIDDPNTIYQIKIGKKDIEITKLTPDEVKEFVAAPKPADTKLTVEEIETNLQKIDDSNPWKRQTPDVLKRLKQIAENFVQNPNNSEVDIEIRYKDIENINEVLAAHGITDSQASPNTNVQPPPKVQSPKMSEVDIANAIDQNLQGRNVTVQVRRKDPDSDSPGLHVLISRPDGSDVNYQEIFNVVRQTIDGLPTDRGEQLIVYGRLAGARSPEWQKFETIDLETPQSKTTKTQTIDFNHGGIREVKIQDGIKVSTRIDGEWKDIILDSFGPIGIRNNGEIIIENSAGLYNSAIITDQNGNYLPPVGGRNYDLKKNAIYYVQNSSNEYFEVKIGSDNIEINKTDPSKIPARNNNALTFNVGEYKTQVDNQINLRIDGGDNYKEFSLGLLNKGVLVNKDGTIKFINSNKSQDSKIFFSDGTELPIDTPIETGRTYYIQSKTNPDEKYKVERKDKEVTISRSTDDLGVVDAPKTKQSQGLKEVANLFGIKIQAPDGVMREGYGGRPDGMYTDLASSQEIFVKNDGKILLLSETRILNEKKFNIYDSEGNPLSSPDSPREFNRYIELEKGKVYYSHPEGQKNDVYKIDLGNDTITITKENSLPASKATKPITTPSSPEALVTLFNANPSALKGGISVSPDPQNSRNDIRVQAETKNNTEMSLIEMTSGDFALVPVNSKGFNLREFNNFFGEWKTGMDIYDFEVYTGNRKSTFDELLTELRKTHPDNVPLHEADRENYIRGTDGSYRWEPMTKDQAEEALLSELVYKLIRDSIAKSPENTNMIQPAIFKKDGDKYILVSKGKMIVDISTPVQSTNNPPKP